ncbi:uncharacterized protein LOC114420482 [Glycine soja]|uniref:uncharacterized protein n=1 Tax=Glycine max TaxID=3847 RepID=UPI0003DEAAD4|nr:uncharacterized protein LOC102669627 [Glycine max]XP_028242169.1 uncharacterized protein LOC114420482 [Glycine soja]|eukprot:XP_006584297.1 uncharacterized protein LOC102669627 [Glycine max]
METHLEANDLWKTVEEDYEVFPLPANPTMAQIKNQKERKARKSKAKATLFAAVSQDIFTRIMTIKSAFEDWNFLKDEYEGDERIKGMQAMNLIREFEMQKMKEYKTIKEYANKLLSIANKLLLLHWKILIKDLSKITLAKLVSAMQSQEQRRLMRQDGAVEGALPAKHHHAESSRKKYVKKNQPTSSENSANNQNKGKGKKKNYPPCQHCGKLGHPPYKCWKRPDAKCSKCNRLGHEAIICRSKVQQHEADAQVVARGRRLYFYCNVLFDEE